jgi:hypothetical protein
VVPGQRRLKLTEGQTSAIIKVAAQHPQDKRNYVATGSGSPIKLLPGDPIVESLGMNVNKEMIQVLHWHEDDPDRAFGIIVIMQIAHKASGSGRDWQQEIEDHDLSSSRS